MMIPSDDLEHNWNARDFYDLVLFLSWESKAQRDYQEIIAAKHKPK